MVDCANLIHPFQNDPGVSQRQRIMDDLLSGSAKIDGRNTADLLDYFVQLSRHVNYYDNDLNISDWQPFFQKSIPFSLAAIIKYDRAIVAEKIDTYNKLFDKRPSNAGMQLLLHYLFQQVINRINTWHLQLKGSGLPAELILEKLIKDKLQEPLRKFICYNHVAVRWYCVKSVNFLPISNNPVWNLDFNKLNAEADKCKPIGSTKRKRLIALRNKIKELLPSFLDPIRIISDTASQSMEQSLFPLKEELQKQHTPHLALLFAFLKLFQHLQGDLNTYTKKHLDFFYKQVLKLKARDAVADKAHIVFEIQKQLDKYLLKKGLLVKDGKDNNKAEILFALEDEIVVNKAQVIDKRTLFLNNQDAFENTYLEGVYMAPHADKADGLLKDFKDPALKSFATLGSKLSKYTDPENKFVKQYPNARIGFILASPVLFLNEGTRTIDITLACQLQDDYCKEAGTTVAATSNSCCDDTGAQNAKPASSRYPAFIKAPHLYDDIVAALNETYYYVSQDLIADAVKKGISKDLEKKLRDFLIDKTMLCYSEIETKTYDETIKKARWDLFLGMATVAEQEILGQLFKPRKGLKILFSGEEEWIESKSPAVIAILPVPLAGNKFLLKINVVLEADQGAVTFYNKDKLKEDFSTTLPLVKIELDDKIKLGFTDEELKTRVTDMGPAGICCLLRESNDADEMCFCITPDFIADAGAATISTAARNYLQSLIGPSNKFQKCIAKIMLDCFLDTKDSDDVPIFNTSDKNIIKQLFNTPGKNYCRHIRHTISLYHFFRNVIVLDKLSNNAADVTRIDVSVCGLRKFVVQNDESVQDVNGPIYPFGTRPDIVDFSVVNPILCITPALIVEADNSGISLKAKNYLLSLLTPANGFKKTIAKNSLESFLNTKDEFNNPIFTPGDKTTLRLVFNDPTKKYCLLNQSGPEFYIGSNEVFCKKWKSVRVNLNWKDKPNDFREYYKAYVVEDVLQQIFGLDENNFKIRVAALQNGTWTEEANDRRLFDVVPPPAIPGLIPLAVPPCPPDGSYTQGILLKSSDFPGLANGEFSLTNSKDAPFTVSSRNGFIKVNLREQDFLHKDYGFVLARQMMALGKYPDQLLEGAVYRKNGATVIVFRNFGNLIRILEDSIGQMDTQSDVARAFANALYDAFNTDAGYNPLPAPVPPAASPVPPPPLGNSIDDPERDNLYYRIYDALDEVIKTRSLASDVVTNYQFLKDIYSLLDPFGTKVVEPLEILIPNEPWTPIIKNMSLDYTATATNTDIDLIHLYPYTDTYKKEELELQPTLFPAFCDEGTLYIGLKDLVPGSNVNMLFQLAEATADSESDPEDVTWHYLDNNQWKTLRTGFEILDDASDGLTTSGIIKFALPENMTKENTILPKDLHWIKASIPKSSKTVSETIEIYTQAIRSVFTNETTNDKLRLGQPLTAGAISKLNDADANVKKLNQPFDSFGGRKPEAEGHFYVRVSELLRHKGRAIQKFDYERLALEAFPQLFKVKCINHSYALNGHKYKNDFPVAPGYVLLAVIPDLNQLKAAQSFEPRVPVSMLDDIQDQLRKITSPFVRFRAMNPRYEKIHFCLKVILVQGRDESYYREKVKQDLSEFLAPWAVGKYDKLTFGQCVSRSEIIGFLERRDYVDYILDLVMRHDDDAWPDKSDEKELVKPVCPKTPRSILIAGSIDVCIGKRDCENWEKCRNPNGEDEDCCNNVKIPIAEYCIKENPE